MSLFRYLLCLAIVTSCLISPLCNSVLALDYEAKPVNSVLMAPIRAAGAISGGAACALFSGPVDDGFHASKKATGRIAGSLGDEKGKLQVLAAAPVAVPLGMIVGGIRGFGKGAVHGAKAGWDKPFSRWSFVTMEDKSSK